MATGMWKLQFLWEQGKQSIFAWYCCKCLVCWFRIKANITFSIFSDPTSEELRPPVRVELLCDQPRDTRWLWPPILENCHFSIIPIFSTKMKRTSLANEKNLTSKNSCKSILGWLQLLYHFCTEHREKQLKKKTNMHSQHLYNLLTKSDLIIKFLLFYFNTNHQGGAGKACVEQSRSKSQHFCQRRLCLHFSQVKQTTIFWPVLNKVMLEWASSSSTEL